MPKNKRSSFNILLNKLEIIDTNSCDIIVAYAHPINPKYGMKIKFNIMLIKTPITVIKK